MTTKYRIFAHNGQVTAIALGNESPNFFGVEVASGESKDIAATLKELAPKGVGSPWKTTTSSVVSLAVTPENSVAAATAKTTKKVKKVEATMPTTEEVAADIAEAATTTEAAE